MIASIEGLLGSTWEHREAWDEAASSPQLRRRALTSPRPPRRPTMLSNHVAADHDGPWAARFGTVLGILAALRVLPTR